MKKVIYILVLVLFIAVIPNEANAFNKVKIDKKHFSDKILRMYIKEMIDTDGDGYLSKEEIKEVKSFDMRSTLKLKDMQYFKYIEELCISGNSVKTIENLQMFPRLRELHIESDTVESIDISHNKKLEKLWVTNLLVEKKSKPIKKLDISKNKKLKEVMLTKGVYKLDVKKNIQLEELIVSGPIKELDLSNNVRLKKLHISNAGIQKVKLGKKKYLTELTCIQSPLKSIDISRCKNLEDLYIRDCKIDNISTEKNTKLKSIYIDGVGQ